MVSAHPYCAHKSTCHIGIECTLSNKIMHNERADGHCCSFACFQQSWTFCDKYFSLDGSFFSTDFLLLHLSEKMTKIYFDFLQKAPLNSIFVTLCLSDCLAVSNASWKVKFCKSFDNIWNYVHNRASSTKYDLDHLPLMTLTFLTINPCRPYWIMCTNFSKVG